MLYRKQSFYVLISIIISYFSLYFYPYSKKNIKNIFDVILLLFIIICLILSITSFLLFKRKKIQLIINRLNILVHFSLFILIVFFSYYQFNKINFLLLRKRNLFLILLSVYLLYLSNKRIRRDIELINSMDRIR
ncbi:DUF4293 family protein [Blattabacterium cuenoti]|uniref:DUF4293 family protein n=1 Tax=Blattabacterium cuenoti TaxID=1653831 RepID=UPI00163CEF67|nr:DUF4293 family protein [Blattabacterium cuenoti]